MRWIYGAFVSFCEAVPQDNRGDHFDIPAGCFERGQYGYPSQQADFIGKIPP